LVFAVLRTGFAFPDLDDFGLGAVLFLTVFDLAAFFETGVLVFLITGLGAAFFDNMADFGILTFIVIALPVI